MEALPKWVVRRTGKPLGLKLITSGEFLMHVASLDRVTRTAAGTVWLDVQLTKLEAMKLGTASNTASINLAHVVYIVELDK